MAGGDHGSGVDPTDVVHFRAGRAAPSPAPGDGALEVAFSLDAALVDVFPTTLRSLTAHTVVPLRVTLLTRGIDAAAVAAISRDQPDVAVAWFAAEGLRYPPLELLGHTTISTMDRLWLPRIVGWADRVVYLDIDVAVQDDIRPLHDRDLEGRPLAARPSLHPDWRTGTALAAALVPRLPAEAAAAFHDEFGPPAAMGFPCFNAGVLVLDLRGAARLRLHPPRAPAGARLPAPRPARPQPLLPGPLRPARAALEPLRRPGDARRPRDHPLRGAAEAVAPRPLPARRGMAAAPDGSGGDRGPRAAGRGMTTRRRGRRRFLVAAIAVGDDHGRMPPSGRP